MYTTRSLEAGPFLHDAFPFGQGRRGYVFCNPGRGSCSIQTPHWPFRADGRGRLLNCHVYGPGEVRFLHGVRCDGLRNHESGDLILVPQTSLARRGAISRQFARSPGSKAFDSTYRAGGLLGQNAMATNHLQCEPSLQLPLGLCLRPSLWLRVRLEDKPGPQPTSPARFLLLTQGFWPTSSDSS